jgi:hypothetical protein
MTRRQPKSPPTAMAGSAGIPPRPEVRFMVDERLNGLCPRNHRYAEAYLLMAQEAKYRPQAPSDGFGTLLLTREQVRDPHRLTEETLAYVERFEKEEDTRSFNIGCSNFTTNRALIWTIEAARSLCGGVDDLALQLLEMAVDEIKRESRRVDD